jgi:serine protease Do
MTRYVFSLGAAALLAGSILCEGNAIAQGKSGGAGAGGATRSNSAKILEVFKPVVAKTAAATVSVRLDGKQVALGAIVDADGYILTKDSELRTDKIVVRFKDGKELPATKIAANDVWDVAMLKVDAKDLTPVSWSFSRVAPVGNFVATPGPSDTPVAIGVVSVAARNLPPGPRVLLPTNTSNRGYLGIQMEEAESGGAKITVVTAKSPAEKAGLKVGDIIVAVEGREVSDPATLSATVGRFKPGDTITVRYRRDMKEEELKATLDKRPAGFPADRGDLQNSMGTERSERRTGFPVAIQHDTVLKAAECGGPLVDLEGRVIGINIARGGRTDTYAIPAESILPLLPDLMAGKSSLAPRILINLAERIKAAEEALKTAELDKTATDKRLADAKAALERLLAERKKVEEQKKEEERKKEEDKNKEEERKKEEDKKKEDEKKK